MLWKKLKTLFHISQFFVKLFCCNAIFKNAHMHLISKKNNKID